MTEITAGFDGKEYVVSAKDHATGSPEVCAGISAIMYALGGALLNAEDTSYSEFRLEPGDASFRFSGGAEANVMYNVALIGLQQIAISYPEFANFKNFSDFRGEK